MNILRLGIYQLLYLDKAPDYAVIYSCVEMAKKYGHKGYGNLVNAILRNFVRKKEELLNIKFSSEVEYISYRFSLPEWLILRWIQRFGYDFTFRLCEEIKKKKDFLTLRVNNLYIDKETLKEKLINQGLIVQDTVLKEAIAIPLPLCNHLNKPITVKDIYGYNEGYFYVQDIGSILVSKILDPKEEETVIDVCAAPGGKTTHIAQIMNNTGLIIAIDKSKSRLKQIELNCNRLKISNVKCYLLDAEKNLSDLPQADRVIVDVPCSSLGTLSHRPDILWNRTYEDFLHLPNKQLNILINAALLVKNNGILVYSTCTFELEETENVINEFLKIYPNFKLVSFNDLLPQNWKEDKEGMLFLYPHIHKTDGFFVAKLKRMY